VSASGIAALNTLKVIANGTDAAFAWAYGFGFGYTSSPAAKQGDLLTSVVDYALCEKAHVANGAPGK
jgi:hypothetical protein